MDFRKMLLDKLKKEAKPADIDEEALALLYAEDAVEIPEEDDADDDELNQDFIRGLLTKGYMP